MIKKMRRNFIITAMGALVILLLAIFITLNLYMSKMALVQVDSFIDNVMANGGKLQAPENVHGGPPRQEPKVEGFSLFISDTGEIIEVLNNSNGVVDSDLAIYAKEAFENDEPGGMVGDYRYRGRLIDGGRLVVFADVSVQDELLTSLLNLSYTIGGISLFLLFGIISFLSKFITQPVEVAFEKQKRFISDSSHELKTPLSIMSANLDLLKMEIGENERIDSMGDGIKRMNMLIHELLVLAKTEKDMTSFKSFDLSHEMELTILPLEVIAFDHGNRIDCQIESGVLFKGDEEGIRKMINALMENAIKYSSENTDIKASLYKKGKNVIIEIYNEGIGVSEDQKAKLFDKFYRVDDSRQRETGGYGIGLSIVKNVIDIHKGKIQVESTFNECILFKITLPL